MSRALGGPADIVDDPDRHLPRAPHALEVFPAEAGRVRAIAVREVGVAVLELGGGRLREDQGIDHAVGLVDVAGLGEEVGPGGHPLAVIHAADKGRRAGRRADPGRLRRRRRARRAAAADGAGGVNGPSGPGPLAELHVHLEATASPALIRRLAKRHGMTIPPGTLDGERYVWRDFLDFLEVFDRAVTVIRTAEDYRDVTLEYLTACAGEGAIYVEVTISPDHAAAAGIPYADLLDEQYVRWGGGHVCYVSLLPSFLCLLHTLALRRPNPHMCPPASTPSGPRDRVLRQHLQPLRPSSSSAVSFHGKPRCSLTAASPLQRARARCHQ